jgi:hypothetical protein
MNRREEKLHRIPTLCLLVCVSIFQFVTVQVASPRETDLQRNTMSGSARENHYKVITVMKRKALSKPFVCTDQGAAVLSHLHSRQSGLPRSLHFS